MPAFVRFHVPELQEALGALVERGRIGWPAFFATAETLRDRGPEELVRLQALLVDALVDGAYDAEVPVRGQVAFAEPESEDEALMRTTDPRSRIVARDADLPYALRDLDELRPARGTRPVRRAVAQLITGEGSGWVADSRLIGVLPRAFRLATGAVMPGYRAVPEEERAAGGSPVYQGLLVEAEVDGRTGLLSYIGITHSEFETTDWTARLVGALEDAIPGARTVAVHRGEPRPVDEQGGPWGWREAMDGLVVFRGAVAAPPPSDQWAARVRGAFLQPVRPVDPLPEDELWAELRRLDGDDLERTVYSLERRLVRRPVATIRGFQAALLGLLDRLDRPDVKSAAEAEFGWLSDDAFEDVRLGLLVAGRALTDAALRDPGSVEWASIVPAEELASVAVTAYEERTGEVLEVHGEGGEAAPDGTTVLSATAAGEACVRWWADPATAVEQHRAAERPSSGEVTVLATARGLAYTRVVPRYRLLTPTVLG